MRPRKCRIVRFSPMSRFYKPRGIPMMELQIVALKDEEWEAIRLADYQGMEQEEAAKSMGISRPTFSRMLTAARRAVAKALAEGSALRIGESGASIASDGSTTPIKSPTRSKK